MTRELAALRGRPYTGVNSRPPSADRSFALQRLTGEALRFWSDPTHRERMLRDILDARGTQARARALQAVDDAVTRGMAALGFQRAPIRSLSLVIPSHAGILGLKYATSDLQIGRPVLQRELGPGGAPDGVVETWIHESLHGRASPWGPGRRAEAAYPGFEEGLVEGITRSIARRANLRPGLQVYGRYVQTYEELARVIGVSPEVIYEALYRLPNGSVMDGFVSAIDAVRGAGGEPPLTPGQRGRLEATAKRLFDALLRRDTASASRRQPIRRAWRRALR
jgi:hypothetical protein